MTQPKSCLNDQQWTRIEELLNQWFAHPFNRSSWLPFNSTFISRSEALLAASIFKRGAKGIVDEVTGIQTPVAQQHREISPPLPQAFSKWNDFFQYLLSSQAQEKETFLVIDRSLANHHPEICESCQRAQFSYLIIDCTEELKSLKQARYIDAVMGPSVRQMIVVGGGICCDLAAFVGGFRGVDVILVPSTLLALVDAGLGGKTGVNHPSAGKNQIGLFVDIQGIAYVSSLLTSLPPQGMHDGLGEVLKHAWLSGQFERWELALNNLLSQAPRDAFLRDDVQSLVKENIFFKRSVVRLDPFEANLRILLNLAHTVAHLVEALCLNQNYRTTKDAPMSHGLAVIIGLWALIRAGLLVGAPTAYMEQLCKLLELSGVEFPLLDLQDHWNTAVQVLTQDKKNYEPGKLHSSQRATVRCVLPAYGCLRTLPSVEHLQDFTDAQTRQIPIEPFLRHLQSTGLFL